MCFDLSGVEPHESGCLDVWVGPGDDCAKENRERIKIMIAGSDGTIGWRLRCLTEFHARDQELFFSSE